MDDPLSRAHESYVQATPAAIARRIPWVPLVLLAIGAFLVARNPADVRRVAELLPRMELAWLLAALVFQVLTYACVGIVYRILAGAMRAPLTLAEGTRMAVVNLFVNSAVPSAGLSGNLFLVHMLDRRGIPAGKGAVIVLCERAVYFIALFSFVLVFAGRELSHHAGAPAVPFFLAGGIFLGLALRAALRRPTAAAERVGRVLDRAPRLLRARLPSRERLLADARRIEEAGGASAITPFRLLAAFAAEWGLLVFDALTIWALLHALGVEVSPLKPAIAYGVSTLVALSVLVPGALEVSLGGVLLAQRIPAAAALGVTALFHVLSLWVVMPLGGWFYGRATRAAVTPRPEDATSSPTRDPRSARGEDPSP